MTNQSTPDQILLSVRLGWLTVEAFGRLQRWAKPGVRGPSTESLATRRFSFSDRQLSRRDQLFTVIQQLKGTAEKLVPEYPLPFPTEPDQLREWARQDMDQAWSEFEDWSREVWICLQIRDPLAGQAFTFGGSLAETCWHAETAGPDRLNELLRAERLEAIAERFLSITQYLPDHAAAIIRHTLYRWRIAGSLQAMDDAQKERLLTRLEAQAKVWHDLLFGLMRAGDYLLTRDRRLIAWGAFAATALLTVLIGLGVWLAVLFLSGAGRALLASTPGAGEALNQAGTDLAARLLDWQNWASLLAALSSVVVVLTGFVSRFSGWMLAFHRRVEASLALRQMVQRALRL